MTDFNWTIANLERNTADGGVFVAHWRVTAEDGEYTASSYGTQSFTPDPTSADFIAFEALTEADVLGWVHAEVSQDDTEASIQAKLDEMAAPQTVVGMPWSNV